MRVKSFILSFFLFCFINVPAFANIKVGTMFTYPPFVLSSNEGFDIQLMQLLCKRMGETCDIIPMNLKDLAPALLNGQIDLAIGGIPLPLAPTPNYIFSLPYMVSKGQFMVLKTSNMHTLDELFGKDVGVMLGNIQGGAFYNFLLGTYPDKFKLDTYNDVEDLVTALNNQDISAAFMHQYAVNYWVQNSGGKFTPFANPTMVGNGIGIMSVPKNQALINKINQLLIKIEKDNSYIALYNTYFGL